MKSISLCFAFFILTLNNVVKAQEIIPLYESEIPNSKPNKVKEKQVKMPDGNIIVKGVTIPTLTIYKAKAKQTSAAVIICPGGGYGVLSLRDEGTAIAAWFAERGVTALVLKYRLPNEETMLDRSYGPMMDVQQAIYLLRKNAQKWQVNADKIGIMGFSAGGHLASTLLTHFDDLKIQNREAISLKPNFAILAYPVISFQKGTTGGTKDNLIGNSVALADYFSAEKHINAETAPTFLIHAADDTSVPFDLHTLKLYQALLANKVPSELHVFQKGGHGFGAVNPSTKQNWLPLALDWLKLNGFF